MKGATIQDLLDDLPKIKAWLTDGEEILISENCILVGKLIAANPPVPAPGPLSDFEARARKTWGDRFFTQEEVDEMRAFETGEP